MTGPLRARVYTRGMKKRLAAAAWLALVVPAACSGAGGPAASDAAPPVAEAGSELDAAPPPSPPPPPRPPADAAVSGPALLSETGLYADIKTRTLAPGVIPYGVRFPLWTDAAEKTRYLWLPPGARVDTSSMDEWTFPSDTRAWKEFRVDGKLVETRVLWKRGPGEGASAWWMMAYVWRADGSDADATVPGVPAVQGTSHDVPPQTSCGTCHNDVRDALAGVGAIQLSEGATLAKWTADGLFTAPPPAITPPGAGAVMAALGYLHGNCGHCHNERAPRLATQSAMRLRLLVGETDPANTQIHRTTVNVKMQHVFPPDITVAVAPGQPEKSELWVRMGLRDFNAMPPLGTKVVDDGGRDAVRAWILGLAPPPP